MAWEYQLNNDGAAVYVNTDSGDVMSLQDYQTYGPPAAPAAPVFVSPAVDNSALANALAIAPAFVSYEPPAYTPPSVSSATDYSKYIIVQYQQYLGRTPNNNEIAAANNALNSGSTLYDLTAGIQGSPEYQQRQAQVQADPSSRVAVDNPQEQSPFATPDPSPVSAPVTATPQEAVDYLTRQQTTPYINNASLLQKHAPNSVVTDTSGAPIANYDANGNLATWHDNKGVVHSVNELQFQTPTYMQNPTYSSDLGAGTNGTGMYISAKEAAAIGVPFDNTPQLTPDSAAKLTVDMGGRKGEGFIDWNKLIGVMSVPLTAGASLSAIAADIGIETSTLSTALQVAKGGIQGALSGGDPVTGALEGAAAAGISAGLTPEISTALSSQLSKVIEDDLAISGGKLLANALTGAAKGALTGGVEGAIAGAEIGAISSAVSQSIQAGGDVVTDAVKETASTPEIPVEETVSTPEIPEPTTTVPNIAQSVTPTPEVSPEQTIQTPAIDEAAAIVAPEPVAPTAPTGGENLAAGMPDVAQVTTYTDPSTGEVYALKEGEFILDASGNPMTQAEYEKSLKPQEMPKEDSKLGKTLSSIFSAPATSALASLLGIGGKTSADTTPTSTATYSPSYTTPTQASPYSYTPRSTVTYSAQGSPGSQALAQALNVGSPSAAISDTGKTDSPETGGTPQNVWNLASLRVKDATGSSTE